MKNAVLLTTHSASSSKTKHNYNQMTTLKTNKNYKHIQN